MIPFAGHQVSLLFHLAAVTTMTVTTITAHAVGAFADRLVPSDPWRQETRAVSYDRVGPGEAVELLNYRL